MKIHNPPMTFKNEEAQKLWEEGLKKNGDFYGNAVYRYASEWATLMEAKLQEGIKLIEIAASSSHEADTEAITGFMYSCAVSLLSSCWIHGEQLRRWYNKEVQIGDEGDKANESNRVLNTAMIGFGER